MNCRGRTGRAGSQKGGNGAVPVFDFHTHIFPDSLAPRAVAKLAQAAGLEPCLNGTRADLLSGMRAAGIDASLVLPVATNPLKCAALNDLSARLSGADGVYYAGAMHPLCPDLKREMRRVASLGLRVVKIHPLYQETDIDAPASLRLLEAAAENGIRVLAHAGDDIGYPGVRRADPPQIENALRQVGDAPLILAHAGGWLRWEHAARLSRFPSVMIDISFSLGPIRRRDGSVLQGLTPEAMRELIAAYTPARVLFGTDSPWGDQAQTLQRFRQLGLAPEAERAILWDNAARLVGAREKEVRSEK